MTFIGVITNSKEAINIENELVNNLDKSYNIILINEKNIDNIKSIKFNTLIINTKNSNILIQEDILKKILVNTKYLIINADIDTNLNLLDNLHVTVITYGINQKSTITTSSVDNEDILICVQRNIQTINNNIIEPCEIKFKSISNSINDSTHSIMASLAVLLIYEVLNPEN